MTQHLEKYAILFNLLLKYNILSSFYSCTVAVYLCVYGGTLAN